MDDYQGQMADLSSLSDEDLASLESRILSAFESADEADDLDAMSQAADALDQVRTERDSRGGSDEDDAADVDDSPADEAEIADEPIASSGVEPVAASAEAEAAPEAETETTAGEPVTASAEPEAEAEAEQPEPVMAGAEAEVAEPEPVTASAEVTEDEIVAMVASGLSAADRRAAAKSGAALPDGSFPITEAADVDKAVHSIGRSKHDAGRIRRHIIKRARALHALDRLPDTWGVTAASTTPEPVMASGTTTDHEGETAVDIPEDRQPVITASGVKITAGADIPGKSAGSEFSSMAEVSQAMLHRMQSVRRVSGGGDGEHLIVASIQAPALDDSLMLRADDAEGNAAKIRERVEHAALTASGGYCAPLEVKYDLFGLGSSARPVRDGLVGFGADRGGIRYVTPPALSGVTGAIDTWTAATDADPQSETKAKLVVTCAGEQTAYTDAVTMQLQFGNLMSRAYPELVTRNTELALIAHARQAERNLLTKISAGSTALTAGFVLGTTRDLLLAISKASAGYRNRHRMTEDTALRVVLPVWVIAAMREDLAYQQPGDGSIAVAQAEIEGYLADRNVNVTWHLDDTFAAQSAGGIVDFPSTVVWHLFAEGTWLFLDGGTLDLGIVRDSTLVGTNDYITFTETFEGAAKIGVESLKITSTTHVAGKSSLPISTS